MCYFIQGINYAKAAATCQDLGGDIAQPTNKIDSNTLSIVLANFTANMTSTRFWIGKSPFEFAPLLVWQM